MVLCLQTSMNLCLATSHQFSILFPLSHEASFTHSTKTLVIFHGDQLAVLVIVTGATHRALAPVALREMFPRRKWAVPESVLCDSHCSRGSSLSTWGWRQVQIFSPGAHRKQHGQYLTFLQAAFAVLLRKTWELWLNITVKPFTGSQTEQELSYFKPLAPF